MGDVFCLVILQNGNRRKLKLATGTYAEFLEKLTAVVDVDLENTLIQMFDTDLDDFVDFVPEDEIPNKAKLRVVSRGASILCNAAVAANAQNVAATSPQNPIVTQIEDAPHAVLSYKQVSGSDKMQVDDAAISHMSMHDSDDHLKFVLPPSFGIWCDTFLRSKQPLTEKVKMHIISVLFKACYNITAHPTPRLYNKVLDSLVAKYPHVMEGKYNRRRWLIALRSWFKNERENLTVASGAAVEAQETCGLNLLRADANDESTYAHAQHAIIWNDYMELEEEMSKGNVNELPLNDRVVIGTEGVPAASPATARPDTSQGRSSSTYSSESERRYGSFSFHLEYLPEYIRKALKAKRPLPPKERRKVVRCVVEQMTTMCSRPRRNLIREAAISVVQAFPDALEDRSLDGRLLGRGYDSFFQQLEIRVANNTYRRVKATVAPGAQWCSRKAVKDSYGCVNWQPVRNSEPSEDIDDKIQFLKREGKKSLEEIDVPLCHGYMEETYPEQRSFINADPAPCISKVKEDWPMLFHRPFFYKHGNKLLAKDVKAIFDQKVSVCALPLVQHLKSVPKKEVMYTLMIMQEATKRGNTKAVEEAVLPLLCAYFKEDEMHLFRVLKEETNISEILHELPCTPTIVAFGSIFQKKCFVTCKQQILFTEPVDFSEATCLLFLSYYVFNLVYADPVATTLEFLQREMFTINPLKGSKCRDGRKSKAAVNNKIMKLIHHLQ